MDTDLLVEELIDDGHRLLIELVRAGFDVSAAAWVKKGGLGLWSLYIGSKWVELGKVGDAYRALDSCLQRLPGSGIGMSDVKFLPDADPITRDLIAVRDRYPGGKLATRLHDRMIGLVRAEEVYVYPRITPGLTRDEVLQTVTGLIRQAGPVRPSMVTLRNGTVVRGTPYGLEVSRPVGQPAVVEIKVRDAVDGSTHSYPADEVTNIQ